MRDIDTFTAAYITCALWSSTDDNDIPLDSNYSIEDIAPGTLAAMVADCIKFQTDNMEMIIDDLGRAGHDFWLTRNGHGTGFWDGDWPEHGDALTVECKKYGECDLYVGDDGRIYA